MLFLNISEIDENFKRESLTEDGVCFYDVRQAPFKVYGLYDYKNQPEFKRLPDELSAKVNPGVASLYLDTAGGRARFCTDSPYIVLMCEPIGARKMVHMPFSGSAGFDLFLDCERGESVYLKTLLPPFFPEGVYKSKVTIGEKRMRSLTLNFPLYSGIRRLYVGIDKDAYIGEGAEYSAALPVVYYGSSITQGGCASRPGNAYQSVISRRLNLDFINLGFAGSGRGEDSIVDYMASLDMCAFVSDYDHNAPSVEHLKNTHRKMYEKIRSTHPDIPYIMLSRVDFYSAYNENIKRREVIFDTYKYARSTGDENVYFIDGESVFRGKYLDMCTVDGTHPNDLGFALMADAVGDTLARALNKRY